MWSWLISSFHASVETSAGHCCRYAGVGMAELIESDYGVGDVIALLWFKRKLPKYATKFIEM